MIEGHKSGAVESLRVAMRAIESDDSVAATLAIELALHLLFAPDEIAPGAPILHATADGVRYFELLRERPMPRYAEED